MSNRDNTPPEELLLDAARKALSLSRYSDSSREIQKAWVMGWLIKQLAIEYSHSYDLKRRIDRILNHK